MNENNNLSSIAIPQHLQGQTRSTHTAGQSSAAYGPKRFLRLREVKQITGLSRSSIYEYMDQGHFPKQIPLGPRTVGWSSSEIYAWVDEKIERSLERETSVGGFYE